MRREPERQNGFIRRRPFRDFVFLPGGITYSAPCLQKIVFIPRRNAGAFCEELLLPGKVFRPGRNMVPKAKNPWRMKSGF
jgi:hypothetical protein